MCWRNKYVVEGFTYLGLSVYAVLLGLSLSFFISLMGIYLITYNVIKKNRKVEKNMKKDRNEDRICLLEEQVIRLTKENQAIAKILNERVRPVVAMMEDMIDEEQEYECNFGVRYHG